MPADVEVVAAVIGGENGTYLLAQRPPGKVYAGYWEFPGGKVEPGESPLDAIVREIREELGIEVLEAHPWLLRRHVYEHARVRLRFFRVVRWRGVPAGLDGQRFEFQIPGRETVGPMLPANGPVLRAMSLPSTYAITQLADRSASDFLARLDQALARGLRLIQVREKALHGPHLAEFASAVLQRCRHWHGRVVISSNVELARAIGADGVHLTSEQLARLKTRPDFELVGASTHDAHELELAARLECDYAVLGPVLPTPSHPDASHLGWAAWATLAAVAELPVYALGGLRDTDLETATRHGAHGIAMMSGAWR